MDDWEKFNEISSSDERFLWSRKYDADNAHTKRVCKDLK